jgi:hypothetical protein
VNSSRFLAALTDGCTGLLEFRAFNGVKGNPPVARAFYSAGDGLTDEIVTTFVAAHREHAVYVGIATRADDSSGALANCRDLGALFVDIDFKVTSETEARPRIARFALPPSAVVQSGGGLHVYWFLREPLDLRDPAACAEARGLLRRLAVALGGDLASAEPARVLRVPGTFNGKPEYGAPRPVVLELLEPDRRYNPGELGEVVPPESAEAQAAGPFVLPDRIPEGERNPTLFRYGRSLRAKGWKLARILAELERVNRERGAPPLPDDELADVAHNVMMEADRPTFATGRNGHGTAPAITTGIAINAAEGDLAKVSDEAWAALLAANDPAFFYSFGGAPSPCSSCSIRPHAHRRGSGVHGRWAGARPTRVRRGQWHPLRAPRRVHRGARARRAEPQRDRAGAPARRRGAGRFPLHRPRGGGPWRRPVPVALRPRPDRRADTATPGREAVPGHGRDPPRRVPDAARHGPAGASDGRPPR